MTAHCSAPLTDYARPGLRVLFVGVNPGMRSAAIGHHFAGYSNRFWKLLYEAGFVPEPIGTEDDARLPEWGLGITNLVARPSPGIDSLTLDEYRAGARLLRRKVWRWRPRVVALVGVTLYRVVFRDELAAAGAARTGRVRPGAKPQRLEGARVFVLPNPSGRNAHFSYGEMLEAFRGLAAFARVSARRGT